MKISRKGFVFFTLMVCALVLGGYLGEKIPIDLLAYSISIGAGQETPIVLDLVVIKLTLGIGLKISMAQVLLLLIAIFAYIPISKHVE